MKGEINRMNTIKNKIKFLFTKKVKIRNILIISIIILMMLGGAGIIYALNLSQKQKESPVEGDIHFVESYISERRTTQSDSISIPCFNEEVLLFDTGCYTLGFDAGFHSDFNFRTDLFEQIVQVFPDPVVRQMSDEIYLIYDTDKQTRLFLYFSITKAKAFFVDGFPIIMKKKLANHDFAELKTGASLDDVEKIDPVMSIYKRQFDSISTERIQFIKKQGTPLTSIHLLTDGIIKIVYDKIDEKYQITDIIYNDDFILDGLSGKTDYKIFDEDYLDG
jgi:hypothetical protein